MLEQTADPRNHTKQSPESTRNVFGLIPCDLVDRFLPSTANQMIHYGADLQVTLQASLMPGHIHAHENHAAGQLSADSLSDGH